MTPSQAAHNVADATLELKPNGRLDWRAYVRLWPILAFILLATFYLGGRLETPAQKQARIDRSLAPISAAMERIETAGGLPVVNRRLDALERTLQANGTREARAMERIADVQGQAVNALERQASAIEDYVRHQTGARP